MNHLLDTALDAARDARVDYADIRIVDREREDLATRNGTVGEQERSHSLGFGVRVMKGGAWGFASSNRLDTDSVVAVTRRAAAIAQASARARERPVELAIEPAWRDRWVGTWVVDPFRVPLEEKIGLLLAIDKELRKRPEIAVAEGTLTFARTHSWMATHSGSRIEQTWMSSGAGFSATAVGHGDSQTRSWPNSFGGQHLAMGYEMVRGLPLLENAGRVRDEAIELLTAPPCPEGEFDLVLDSTQLALQIHESCGHASELDRALGMEESFAGGSFLSLDKLRDFRFGSPIVNLVADMTVPGGLATRGYDDDGVRAQRFAVVEDGRFVAYSTTRETARACGEEFSRGCSRADGYSAIPILRIPNLSLSPGDAGSRDDLFRDTGEGLYFETNRSWSIDQMRLNFEFGCEAAWEIRDGRKGRLLKNPTYQGMTPAFWASCDAICGEDEFTLWGVPNCGKGEPMQTAAVSHGASPARFRRVRVRAA